MENKKTFKKILVPTDGSDPSKIAQELAVLIAKKLNSKVTAIHVISHELMNPKFMETFVEVYTPAVTGPLFTGSYTAVPQRAQAMVTDISGWYHQEGEKSLADAVAFFKQQGVSVDQKLIEHADPAETIIDEAQKGNYDLIIMGHSGEEETEPHLGSIAEKVSRHAPTSILIAREKRKISKILVPLDGSLNSEKALQYAVPFAEKIDAEVTLINVQEPSIFMLNPETSKRIGERILSEAAEQVKGIKIKQKLESGNPAKVITRMANMEDYDLIVMGSRGRSAAVRFLLGSVSDHVIHYANRSVLVIR